MISTGVHLHRQFSKYKTFIRYCLLQPTDPDVTSIIHYAFMKTISSVNIQRSMK